jgi:hypothetical protein
MAVPTEKTTDEWYIEGYCIISSIIHDGRLKSFCEKIRRLYNEIVRLSKSIKLVDNDKTIDTITRYDPFGLLHSRFIKWEFGMPSVGGVECFDHGILGLTGEIDDQIDCVKYLSVLIQYIIQKRGISPLTDHEFSYKLHNILIDFMNYIDNETQDFYNSGVSPT